MDRDAPNTSKKEKRIPSRKVRWEKRTVNKPEDFIDKAELQP